MPGERLLFDIEGNGFLDTISQLHCIAIQNEETGEIATYADQPNHAPIIEGLKRLSEADVLIGHNIIKYDVPAIQKVYPLWTFAGTLEDTLVYSRVLWTNLRDTDFRAAKRRKTYPVPMNLCGSHSLKAWGLRMGTMKDDYTGGFEHWSPAMHRYCIQDVKVTAAFWDLIKSKNLSPECAYIERRTAEITLRQEQHGFAFDHAGAKQLAMTLQLRHNALEDELRKLFKPWIVSQGKKTPARNLNRFMTLENGHAEYISKANAKGKEGCWPVSHVKDATYTEIKYVEFNPGSRQHFADRLQKLFGWEPQEFSKDGKPKLDAEMLGQLKLPGAEIVSEFLMIQKRLGQLAEGNQAWLNLYNKETGALHGSVNTNGAVTGRMTHARPNLAQVPGGKAPYGEDCRRLFRARTGKVLVGIDASALELCCLAGYMAPFDAGAYINEVLYGSTDEAKARGEDMHSNNCRAMGLDPLQKYRVGGQLYPGRELAKRFFYAFIYGAGDSKLGQILGKGTGAKAAKHGKKAKQSFLTGIVGLQKLLKRIERTCDKRGYLIGLDGRPLHIRHSHAALNTLLQSAGAVFMKLALVLLDDALQNNYGLVPGTDYEFVANVHDEWQIECVPELANLIGMEGKEAIRKAGEAFEFPCPLSGAFEIGETWAETH